jgi:hypothetical protein
MKARAILLAAFAFLGTQALLFSQSATDDLSPWVHKIIPDLEKLMGEPLPVRPQFQRVSKSVLIQAGDPDVAAHVRWRFPYLREEGLARALQTAQAVAAQAALARLVEGTNVILLRPENQKLMIAWDLSLEEAVTDEFFKLAVIHEIVRYALDRRYDLARRRDACNDGEQCLALQAVVEGRAQWLTRQMAERLGWQRLFPLLAERYLHVPDISPDPGLRTISQSAVRQKAWACKKGMAFYDYLDEHQIKDAARRVFARPPAQVHWIQHPELYCRDLTAKEPDGLSRLEKALDPHQWALTRQPWTPDMLRQVGALFEEKARVEKILPAWNMGRSLVWTHKAKPSQLVAVTLVRLTSPAAARSYFGLSVDFQRKRDAMSSAPCGLPFRTMASHSRAMELQGMEDAVAVERKLCLNETKEVVSANSLLVRHGDQVIEIVWQGIPADMDWARKALAELTP